MMVTSNAAKVKEGGQRGMQRHNNDIYNSPSMRAALGIYTNHGTSDDLCAYHEDEHVPVEYIRFIRSDGQKKGDDTK